MRGYRSSSTTTGISDEQAEQQRRFPTVPVVAQPDRLVGLHNLFNQQPQNNPITAVVLDDGFQHRKIARDLDVVLIDATRSPFTDRCLPAGWLREPVEALARAHAFIITHAELVSTQDTDALRQDLRKINQTAPTFITWHAWKHLIDADNNTLPLSWLAGRKILAACAIGNPAAFIAAAQHHAAATANNQPSPALAGAFILKDHDPYNQRTIQRLVSAAKSADADAIIVTEKDWSKLARVPQGHWPCPIVRPTLAVEFVDHHTPTQSSKTTPTQTFSQLITQTVQNPAPTP